MSLFLLQFAVFANKAAHPFAVYNVPFWQTLDTRRGPAHLSLHWRSSCKGKWTASSIERSSPALAPCEDASLTDKDLHHI